MVGNIKGYNIVKVTAKKLEKNDNFGKCFTEREVTENAMKSAFESKGIVYGLLNKEKVCVALYCFEKQTDEDGKHHTIVKTYNWHADGNEAEDEEFAKVLRTEVSEILLFAEVDKCEWDGEIIKHKGSDGNAYFMFAIMYMSLATTFYLCMDIKAMAYGFAAASLCYFIAAISQSAKKLKAAGKDKAETKDNA